MKQPHQHIDLANLAEDRMIAARLVRDASILRIAIRNLRRWMARDGRDVRPVFREWHGILTRLSRSEIAAFLRSETPMAWRLRQSSPFAGILGTTNRRKIRGRYASA